MFYVYAIYNTRNDKIYIGQTDDPEMRLKLHNNKQFKNSYTSRFDGLWQIVYVESVESRVQALNREKQLKSFRGREFIRNKIKAIPG